MLIFACLYLLLNIYLNEYKLSILDLEKLIGKKKKYKILAVDPHPDDETMTSGGFMSKFAGNQNFELKHICVTKGEGGDELLKLSPEKLAQIREVEYKEALKELGVENFEIWDFPDGGLKNENDRLKNKLKKEIDTVSPDLILVYERDGLYGHPDHITVSSIIQDLATKSSRKIVVLYKTLPQVVLKNMDLPVHMANGKKLKQAEPKYRLPLRREIIYKYRAARKHKSQDLAHGKPLWLLMLLMNNEYFTDKF